MHCLFALIKGIFIFVFPLSANQIEKKKNVTDKHFFLFQSGGQCCGRRSCTAACTKGKAGKSAFRMTKQRSWKKNLTDKSTFRRRREENLQKLCNCRNDRWATQAIASCTEFICMFFIWSECSLKIMRFNKRGQFSKKDVRLVFDWKKLRQSTPAKNGLLRCYWLNSIDYSKCNSSALLK